MHPLVVDRYLRPLKMVSVHLSAVSLFFSFCSKYKFKLHPDKCIVLNRSIRWSGRLILLNGISVDPWRIDGVRQMTKSVKRAGLQFFFCNAIDEICKLSICANCLPALRPPRKSIHARLKTFSTSSRGFSECCWMVSNIPRGF